MTRVAAIDIGTNSVRCLIAEPGPLGALTVLEDLRAYTRLGRGLSDTGVLSTKARQRTVGALKRMAEAASLSGAEHVRAVATSAVRIAANGEEFLAHAGVLSDLDIEIISAQEEGRLAYLSAAHGFDLGSRGAVFDLGGGSVELVVNRGGHALPARSAPLGALAVTERFADGDPLSGAAFARMRAYVHEEVAGLAEGVEPPVTALVGSGGTARATAALLRRRRATDGVSTHGVLVPRAEIELLLERLRRSTLEERIAMPRMPRRRADIITAGVLVVAKLVAALRADGVVVNAMGIREGIVLDLIAKRSALR